MIRFTIRDVLWLTVVVALAVPASQQPAVHQIVAAGTKCRSVRCEKRRQLGNFFWRPNSPQGMSMPETLEYFFGGLAR